MSLSDCPKCWDTPCECGWEYRNYSIEGLRKRSDLLNNIISFKALFPDAKFSAWSSHPETEDDKKLMEFLRAWETNKL